MKVGSSILGLALASFVLSAASAASAQAKEPLIVTRMPDPDPNYVPAPAEKGARGRIQSAEPEGLEQVMQNFGRALGQAVAVQQQQMQSRCRQTLPGPLTPEQRFQWAASCRYERR